MMTKEIRKAINKRDHYYDGSDIFFKIQDDDREMYETCSSCDMDDVISHLFEAEEIDARYCKKCHVYDGYFVIPGDNWD